MILTKEVKIFYNGQVRKYYEAKGYEFPRKWVKFNHTHNKMVYKPTHDSFIVVPVEDLKPNSKALIQWKCDLCENVGQTTYKRYLNSIKLYDGMKLCDKCRQKYLSQKNRDYSEIGIKKRRCVENNMFIRRCLDRDNYSCRICQSNNSLQVHHLESYKLYPELRYDDTNGVTLCKKCHDLFHSIYGRYNFNKEDFIKFSNLNLDDFINEKGEAISSRICYCYEDNEYIFNIPDYCKQNGWHDTNLYRHLKRKTMAFNHKHYFWRDEIIGKTRDDIYDMIKEIESHRKCIRKGDFNEVN